MQKVMIVIVFVLLLFQYSYGENLILEKRTNLEHDIILVRKIVVHGKNIFVLSGESDSIFLFTEDGKLKRKFSGMGQGPGEFENVSGFIINDKNQLVVFGLVGKLFTKIVVFNFNGKIIDEYRINHQIGKLLNVGGILYYTTNDSIYHLPRNKGSKFEHAIFNIYKKNNEEPIFSLPDYSIINPYHPLFKDKYSYPWFPAPFPNRISAFSDGKDSIVVFQNKKRYLFLLKSNKTRKVPFQFEISADKVSEKDKSEYITRIESINRRMDFKKTLSDIEFPKEKGIFSSVIKWDDKFGLLKKNKILIVSSEGKLLYEIAIPEEFFEEDEYAENDKIVSVFVKGKFLYAIIDGKINKYRIVKK